MRRWSVLAIAAACVLALAAGTAQAASSTEAATLGSAAPTATLAPAPLLEKAAMFTVQLRPDLGLSEILVTAQVPTGTVLPVRVRMPVPPGARIDWVGEVGGGPEQADTESRFRLLEDNTVLEMVLTSRPVAQYEATYLVPVRRGDAMESELTWEQTIPASSVRFAVRAPATIDDVVVTPTSKLAPQFSDDGDRLHILETKKMKLGDKTTIKVVYRAWGATDEQGTGVSGSLSIVLGVLAAAVLTALIALVFVMRKGRRSVPRA